MSFKAGAHEVWRVLTFALVMALAVALVVMGGKTPEAQAETAVIPGVPQTVSADGLPTWQIDGVVWQQATVGNTVYAVGDFTKARPPGVAVGGAGEIAANYIFAYDIRTGNRVPSFSHQLNGQANAVAASPDGTRIYVGGDFTTVDGITRSHIAAFDTATGALVTTFTPVTSSRVSAITVTASVVYVGGFLKSASSKPSEPQQARSFLAAFSTADGALQTWAPAASDSVMSLVASPDGSRIIVGGHFLTLNGTAAPGLGSVGATSGATLPFAATARIVSGGPKGGVTSLRTDGTQVYGTGYAFGSGKFEGTFGVDPNTGTINFANDCHGDTYDTFPSGQVLYAVSHVHTCEWIGGFKNTAPWTMHYGTAFSTYPTGTNTGPDDYGWNYAGVPSSSILHWFPTITPGTYTGQGQAGWSLTGTSSYVAMGGEFRYVNSVAQQGLVRFAVPAAAPNKLGAVTSSVRAPAAVSISSGAVKLSWTAAWDRDNTNLTYNILRDSSTTPIYSVTTSSNFWTLPSMTFTDTGLVPGSTHTYKLQTVDPFSNKFTTPASSAVTVSSTQLSAYAQDVLNDGASSYWRLGETSGSTSIDYAGSLSLARGTGVAGGASGAIMGDNDGAAAFDGTTNGSASSSTLVQGPSQLTVEAWVRTTSAAGGKIVGFGNAQTGTSSSYDRHLYIDSAGRAEFGVYNGGAQVVRSPSKVADGSYHHLVGTLSPSGISLYVDGRKVATNASGSSAQSYSGYWRVGGDNLGSWPNKPTSNFLAGTIDDVAIYPAALTSAQVQRHYLDSGRALGGPAAPTDTLGKAIYQASPDIYWRLDESSGTTVTDASVNANNGKYFGGVTLAQASPVSGATGTAVKFNGSSGSVGSSSSFLSPTSYTESAWFKTSTTAGGKIIGFGSSQSGSSTSYDRHVYLLPTTGQLAFGTRTTAMNIITSPLGYNDNTWHQAVATQSGAGMRLYVDGQLVASSAQTGAQSYAGYWRVGGDSSWAGSDYLAGTIDEVAIWSDTALTGSQVTSLYQASPAATTTSNKPPVATIGTPSCTNLACTFDGSGSSDPDGSVVSYAWTFPGGASRSGPTTTFTFPSPGTYQVALQVTDNGGLVGTTTTSVSVTAANTAPTAVIAAPSCTGLKCSFSGSGSQDADGSITSYAWDFGGDGSATSVAPSHTFTAAGSYAVTLTVTDNNGAAGSRTVTVSVDDAKPKALIAAPVACSALTCSFDGSGSSDVDGTIASYTWSYDDGGTGAGAAVSHTFAAAGSHTAALTVTDDHGATDTATATVSLTTEPTILAQDGFGRSVASGWGTADEGGPWTTSKPSSFSVAGNVGLMALAAPGASPSIYLNGVSATSTDTEVTLATDKLATGGGLYANVSGRRVSGSGEYRLKARITAGNTLGLTLVRTASNGSETTLRAEAVVPGLTYTLGSQIRLRLQVVSTDAATTSLQARAWKVGSSEPSAWLVTATDTTPALQAPGGVGLTGYLSATSTNAPVSMMFDDVDCGPVG